MPQPLTVIPATALGVICIEGDDAQSFLQGQSTPDLRKIALGESVFGAFCNAQGRVIANGWFQSIDAGFRLVISRDLVPTLIKRLRMYVLRAKVTVSDATDHASLWVSSKADPRLEYDWLIKGPMGLSLFAAQRDTFPEAILALQGEAFELALIQAGIPLVTLETSECYIPHMLSMDFLGGLSFDKGCYTGQEIVTRTQFLGKVKRTLHRLATDHSIQPKSGTPLKGTQSEEAVGEVFAWARLPGGGATGLAIIRNETPGMDGLLVEGHRVTASPVAVD